MDELLVLIAGLDFKTLKYGEAMQVYRLIEDKISMYETAAKKLKEQRDTIKNTLRQRMIDEGLPSVGTEFGDLAPKDVECFTMANFDLFREWLRDGFAADFKTALNEVGVSDTIFGFALEEYKKQRKINDRLDYLKQACYNSKKIKSMHEDPDDTLPPGIGIYTDHKLSIIKPKKGAKK